MVNLKKLRENETLEQTVQRLRRMANSLKANGCDISHYEHLLNKAEERLGLN